MMEFLAYSLIFWGAALILVAIPAEYDLAVILKEWTERNDHDR